MLSQNCVGDLSQKKSSDEHVVWSQRLKI